MNRMTQCFRMFLGLSLLITTLGLAGCSAPETILFEEFMTHLQGDKIAEVTIHKPEAEGQPAKVEGRYRRTAGKSVINFVTEGQVDQAVLDQLKASGVSINYKE